MVSFSYFINPMSKQCKLVKIKVMRFVNYWFVYMMYVILEACKGFLWKRPHGESFLYNDVWYAIEPMNYLHIGLTHVHKRSVYWNALRIEFMHPLWKLENLNQMHELNNIWNFWGYMGGFASEIQTCRKKRRSRSSNELLKARES